jgi:hypothetical protein
MKFQDDVDLFESNFVEDPSLIIPSRTPYEGNGIQICIEGISFSSKSTLLEDCVESYLCII